MRLEHESVSLVVDALLDERALGQPAHSAEENHRRLLRARAAGRQRRRLRVALARVLEAQHERAPVGQRAVQRAFAEDAPRRPERGRRARRERAAGRRRRTRPRHSVALVLQHRACTYEFDCIYIILVQVEPANRWKLKKK